MARRLIVCRSDFHRFSTYVRRLFLKNTWVTGIFSFRKIRGIISATFKNNYDKNENDSSACVGYFFFPLSNAPPSPNGSYMQGRPNDEYFAGSSISLPVKTEMSIPTGQLKNEGSLVLPVMRWATPGDFSNGGEIKITVNPNGHDTWKIQTLTVNFSFANDPGSPHKITWSNIVLSQNSRTRELPFDKNFNPL